MSGLHVNDSGYMVMDSAFSIWFNNIRIPAGGVGNIGFQYIIATSNDTGLMDNRELAVYLKVIT